MRYIFHSKKAYIIVAIGLVLGLALLATKRRLLRAFVLERLSLPFSTNSAVSDLQIGIGLAKKGDYASARKIFEGAYVRDPKNVSLLNNLGYLAAELGSLEKASEYFHLALGLSPQCAECLNNLGSVNLKLKRAGEAKKAFEKAIEFSPNYAEALLNLAVFHEEDGEFRIALGLYRRALPFLEGEEIKKWVTLRMSLLSDIPTSRNLASHEENK